MFSFFRSTIYVRIKPDQLSLRHIESGREMTDTPAIAIETKEGKPTVIAVGQQALLQLGLPNITIENGFKHPRTIIATFTTAELALKYFVKSVLPNKIFTISPVIFLHPLTTLEGGLTQIEIRALAELGLGAGARKVYVWEGQELCDEELYQLSFYPGKGKLLFP